MKDTLKATTKRMIPILAQIVQRYLPVYKIEELATEEKIKAREFRTYEGFASMIYLVAGKLHLDTPCPFSYFH